MREKRIAGDAIIREEACAKINLALHVTGQRSDGYHLLEMLVTFARCNDRLDLKPAPCDSFVVTGRFSDALNRDSCTNLVVRARDALRDALLRRGGTAGAVGIHLQKNLPVASGIGGGSADAAAALRGLMRLWRASLPPGTIEEIALGLGADVPMCLVNKPLIARGIGERVEEVRDMPAFAMVLANPLMGVSTPEVFRRLATKNNPQLVTGPAPSWLHALNGMRNDLEPPARALLPEIGEISAMLTAQGAAFVRMSGSGATCFGIFETVAAAQDAARGLRGRRPDWYFEATETIAGDGHGST